MFACFNFASNTRVKSTDSYRGQGKPSDGIPRYVAVTETPYHEYLQKGSFHLTAIQYPVNL